MPSVEFECGGSSEEHVLLLLVVALVVKHNRRVLKGVQREPQILLDGFLAYSMEDHGRQCVFFGGGVVADDAFS